MKLTIEINKYGKTKIIAEGKNMEIRRAMPELSFLTAKTQNDSRQMYRMDSLFRDWSKEHDETPF